MTEKILNNKKNGMLMMLAPAFASAEAGTAIPGYVTKNTMKVYQYPSPLSKKLGTMSYGEDVLVLSVDAKRVDDGYHVFAKGGREDTGMDALEWIKRGAEMGAGEIVLNSIDTDGVRKGFDLEMLQAIGEVVRLPIIASGGAGCMEDFVTLFQTLPKVDAGLAASIFHYGQVQIPDLKRYLADNHITVRL